MAPSRCNIFKKSRFFSLYLFFAVFSKKCVRAREARGDTEGPVPHWSHNANHARALRNYAIYCGYVLHVRALMLSHKARKRQIALEHDLASRDTLAQRASGSAAPCGSPCAAPAVCYRPLAFST